MKSVSFALLMSCSLAKRNRNKRQSPERIPQHVQDLPVKTQKSQPEASRPSAELQSLIKALSGKWTVDVRFEPNPEMPDGFAATGEQT
jgi:hypothetical protein